MHVQESALVRVVVGDLRWPEALTLTFAIVRGLWCTVPCWEFWACLPVNRFMGKLCGKCTSSLVGKTWSVDSEWRIHAYLYMVQP
jgi:hypothetical protein